MPRDTRDDIHPLRRLLALAAFRRLWAVGGIANAMRWVEILAGSIYTFEVTHSALAVSAVVMVRALPMFLMGAAAGALAEMLDRRRLLIAGQVAALVSSLALLALALTGALQIWHLAAGGFLSGLVWTGEMASRRRLLAEVAGQRDVVTAVAFDSLTANTTRMLGPLIGGVVYQFLGLAAALALTGLCYALTIMLLAGVRHAQARGTSRPRRLLADMAEGVAVVRRIPALQVVILVTIALNVFGFCFTAVLPALGTAAYGATPVQIGLLSAAEPAGALLTGLVLAARRGVPLRPGLMVAGGALFLACLVALAFAPTLPLAIAVLALGGIGTGLFAALQMALPVTRAPADAVSRVLGLVTTCIGMGPVGVLAIGVLADAFGPAVAVPAMAGAGLLLLGRTALLLRRA